MADLFLHVHFDTKAALRSGSARAGYLAVPLTTAILESLTVEEREAIASVVSTTTERKNFEAALEVEGLQVSDFKTAIQAMAVKIAAKAAEKAEHDAKVAALMAGPVEGRVRYLAEERIGNRYSILESARDLIGYGKTERTHIDAEIDRMNRNECLELDEKMLQQPIENHIRRNGSRWVIVDLPSFCGTCMVPRTKQAAIEVCAERNTALQRDEEALKAQNEERFSKVVLGMLSAEQAKRFEAGVLPVEERDSCVRDHLFARFASFNRYQKLVNFSHDRDCPDYGEDTTFEVFDCRDGELPNMDAEQFDAFTGLCDLIKQHDGAVYKVRVHTAEPSRHCTCEHEEETRLGVKVTMALCGHTYSREFALTRPVPR